MRSSWRLETGPSWRLVPGGIKVRWSSAFPINSLRLPMTSHGLCRPFLGCDCTERRGLLASPLVQMEPPRTPSTPTVGRPASLPHQMIRRMSPSHPRICYEALPLPLAVLKLGGVVRAPSRCSWLKKGSKDIYMRTRPLRGFGSMHTSSQCPPAALLPVRRTAPNRSVWMVGPASCRTFNETASCGRYQVRIGGWYFGAGSARPCVIKTVLVTPRQASLNCPEPAYGLLEVDRKVRLVPAEREADLVPLSAEGQGILELLHHPCKFLMGIVHKVISIAWISQNLPNDASANSSIFVKKILASAAGPTQPWGLRAGVEEAVHDHTTIVHDVRERSHNLETSLAINAANTPRCSLIGSVDRTGSLSVLGCKSIAIDTLPNRLLRTDALLFPGPAPIRPGVRLTHDVALAADAINIPSPQANTGVTFLDARGSSAPRLVVGFSLLRPSFCLRFNLLSSMSSGFSARRHLSLLCTLMSSTLPSDQIRGYIQDSGDSGSAGANVNYRRLLVECRCAEALIFAQRSADGYLMAPLRQPPP
ncbi:hypothetical protein T05_15426 [Trichinella murrelli]|uniref:Uncharacterized protein n=1 Tax=Trichinella murrelli TaxID=144512 RepID=A0A0V0U3X4_9BILA|nr:hypothetical protein T05_15426 [Trichinella murrelli]